MKGEHSVLGTVEERLGQGAVDTLIDALGGRLIYVPTRPTPGSRLSRAVGHEIAAALAEVYGGRRIAVPNGLGRGHARRIDPAAVERLSADGVSANAIAARLGCTVRAVLAIRRRGRRA